ncbi:hypothetical protein Btru_067796 [Bulinus truncatus]|nr:hypothetical protein Btru_067796 [Bulinus truncatus]
MNSTVKKFISKLTLLLATFGFHCPQVQSQTYDNTADIFKDLLVSSGYNTEVRPVLNQAKPIMVDVAFNILSIVQVNEVEQSFVCNGFLAFFWFDQKLMWNSSNYGGQDLIHPVPEAIWRPRVILMNTLGSRDIFGDEKAPINVNSNGAATWIPGGLFPTSCNLQMTNYPYDEQTCSIKIAAMSLSVKELQFTFKSPDVVRAFYVENGEWDLVKGYIQIGTIASGPSNISSAEITFVMRRRPFFFLINILLPVVFLSFLNILVFIIPVDSGEKIGYDYHRSGKIVQLCVTNDLHNRDSHNSLDNVIDSAARMVRVGCVNEERHTRGSSAEE